MVLSREGVIQRYRALNTGAKEGRDPAQASIRELGDRKSHELEGLARGVRYRLLYEVPMLERPRK